MHPPLPPPLCRSLPPPLDTPLYHHSLASSFAYRLAHALSPLSLTSWLALWWLACSWLVLWLFMWLALLPCGWYCLCFIPGFGSAVGNPVSFAPIIGPSATPAVISAHSAASSVPHDTEIGVLVVVAALGTFGFVLAGTFPTLSAFIYPGDVF